MGETDESTAPDPTAGSPQAGLVEPARLRVVSLAADVLGRLPAEDVPAGLRAIARFAPAKRPRLGGVAIATALDADERFRGLVAEALEKGAAELVATVRDGGSTAASDPLDVGVVAYLTRPDRWVETLAGANRRWLEERESGGTSGDELERLRAEVRQLRADARGEAARVREAVTASGAQAETERAELRRAVRGRTRELRVAERERDDALARAAESDAAAARQDDMHAAELRRLRSRVAEVERAAEAARRGARTERDVDDARLWLLVDTLVQAASGVRRELSLSAPSVRPADGIASAAAADRSREVRDPAGLDRLLALPNVHLIVDGYNVTKTGYGELPLVEQRTRLIGSLAALAAQSGAEITIAFDGGTKPPAQPATPRGLRVLFSAADEIADDLIRRLVAAEPAGRAVVVVTSDRAIVSDVIRDGAWSAASAVLLTRLA